VTLRIGSLFSGYGGLDMAVAAHYDATTAWFVEFDKHPSAILAHHYPDVPNYGDVTSVDWAAVEPVDIITGGFPCQDVSHAGLRRGVHHGNRSGLWEHFAYAIKALRPGLVVIENVSGILSADAHCDVEPCPWCVGDEPAGHMRALGAVLSDLAEIGFDAEWCSVRAADAGAPHGRLRVFIVATARHAGHDAGGTEQGQQPQGATGGPRQSGDDVAPDAARERGLGIPRDISIIGFDDIPQASLVYPKLTTIRQPLIQIGHVAVRLLLEKIEDPDKEARRVTLATELVIRDTCAPPRQ
jgi:DNA (cytosine-5)-methyltransferase 1